MKNNEIHNPATHAVGSIILPQVIEAWRLVGVCLVGDKKTGKLWQEREYVKGKWSTWLYEVER